MNLNIRQLEAFVCVARMGGFSRAASQLHMSQAGLSILIRNLEQRLDTKLVERTTRSVQLTAAGRQILPIAARMLGDAQTIFSIGSGVRADYSGRVALALAPSLTTTVLPRVLKSFHDLYPKVTVAFRECVNEELIRQVFANEVEFGLAFGITATKELECRPIGKDQLVMVCSPDHALAKKRKVSWIDVVNCPIITTPKGSIARSAVEQAFRKINQAFTPIYEPSNALTAVALAREKLGVAIVSSSVGPIIATNQLVMKTLHDPIMKRDMNVVVRSGFSLSEPSQTFIRIFVDALQLMK